MEVRRAHDPYRQTREFARCEAVEARRPIRGEFRPVFDRLLDQARLCATLPFKTTNCIENVNKGLAIYTDRVTYWQNSDQRQRWVGTALLEIEPGLNRVQGYKNLGQLRTAMKVFAVEQKQQRAA